MDEQLVKARSGTRIIFLVIIVLVIGFSVATIIPNRVGPHGSPANACINNLRQIDAAANQFALEHHFTIGAPINYPNNLIPYLYPDKKGKVPSCPSGGTYHISKVGESPTCSLGKTVTPPHVLQ
jgi:hypothetical protein